MNTITKMVVMGFLYLITNQMQAQTPSEDSLSEDRNPKKIQVLLNLKDRIMEAEKEFLKVEVESINQRLENGSINSEEAEKFKREAAEKRALNIENRMAIIDNKIELLRRNDENYQTSMEDDSYIGFSLGTDGDNFAGFKIKGNNRPKRYDVRTTTDLVFAIGFNNAIIDGSDFGDSPYELAGSGFVELGWAWKTRVLQNSNGMRFKYGLSLQWNKLNAKDNLYFEQDGDMSNLIDFPVDLNKSEFRMTNIVVPLHFEFGPSKKIERDTYFRYSTHEQFKVGIGGYAGFNIGTQQKLKYKEDSDRVKQKIRKDYNTSDFVYGLSGYVGIGDVSLYAKYDLNTIFKNQLVNQNNISLGVRFDFD
ncbi:hypothetical protein SAMN03097699_2113 [Flavobacteriaceae bacterium MAR_2010_188]|nr:hypothetical protein SAMN03097699_2113 [Flavobacteriaceae bacterium MAR_2010_188]